MSYPTKKDLNKKWWHRLIKVSFGFSILLMAFIFLAISVETINFSKQNIKIIDNLEKFTTNSSKNINNTIPNFIKIEGKIGCLNDKVEYFSTYDLEKKGICNADLLGNIDVVVEQISNQKEYKDIDKTSMKNNLIQMLNEEKEKKYCLIPKSLNCNSVNIIKYTPSFIYYFELTIFSSILSILYFFIGKLIYYKIILYIVYGNENE